MSITMIVSCCIPEIVGRILFPFIGGCCTVSTQTAVEHEIPLHKSH